jgi:hypothetical protein
MTNQHEYFKNNDGLWECKNCGRVNKSKSKSPCYLVPSLNKIPDNLATREQLERENLEPTANYVATVMWSNHVHFLFERKDTQVIDDNLPPIYSYHERPDNLKTKYELEFESKIPPIDLAPTGVIWWWEDKNYGYFLELYDINNCEDYNLVTKTEIKNIFNLTDKQFNDISDYFEIEKKVYNRYKQSYSLYRLEKIEDLMRFETMANIRLTTDNDDDVNKLEYLLDCKNVPYQKSKKYPNKRSKDGEFRVYYDLDLSGVNIPDTGLSPKEGDLVLSPNNK